MSFLDKFEKKVENVVSGAFSKAFRSEIKPVEIASAVRRSMDERAAVVARDRTIAPNEFRVTLSTTDEENFRSWGSDALAEEIAAAATEHAISQSYSFVGPVTVTFDLDDALTTGQYQIASTTQRGAVAPATANPTNERHPIIDVDGRRYLITGSLTVIGRGTEADIVVDDTGVSRRHLELRVTPGGVICTDLNSTNGMFIEGHKVPAATLVDGNTITIGRTTIMFWNQPGNEA